MRNVPDLLSFRPANGKKRILVIESDSEIRNILSLIFDEEDYEYQMYYGTSYIVLLTRRYQPDLVLLDFKWPFLDLSNGGELCLQLKAERSTRTIPVIIYSTVSSAVISAKNYCNDLFLAKPFDLDELLAKINQLIKNSVSRS